MTRIRTAAERQAALMVWAVTVAFVIVMGTMFPPLAVVAGVVLAIVDIALALTIGHSRSFLLSVVVAFVLLVIAVRIAMMVITGKWFARD